MQQAIRRKSVRKPRARAHFAFIVLYLVLLVLPEVQVLRWVQTISNCLLKDLPGNLSVLVVIEFIKNLLEFRRRELDAPVLENVLQFIIFDKSILFNVEVSKCLLEGAPLYREFLDYHSLDSRQVSLLRQTFSNAFL